MNVRIAGIVLACALLVGATPAAEGGPLVIENTTLRLAWDGATREAVLSLRGTRHAFARIAVPGAAPGDPHAERLTDATYGRGEALVVPLAEGGVARLALFRGLPFLWARATLANPSETDRPVDRLEALTARLDPGVPVERVRALGTAGLTAPADHPGSYAFLALAEPESRHGVVAGWLTHDRGSGVLFSSIAPDGGLGLAARIDYGGLLIPPGGEAESETLLLGWFDDVRLGLEDYADRVATAYAIELPPIPTGYCTWYSSPHGGACDEARLAELAACAAEKLRPYGLEFLQIDDGWQVGLESNGPRKNFTEHRPDGPYPSGMRAAAEMVASHGFTPGIWYMPFAGNHQDPFYADHRDWFASAPDGSPFETPWGGSSLDLTRPQVRKHLVSTAARLSHDWGFRYFKMDGLYTGIATEQVYVNTGYRDDHLGAARLADPTQTHIEAYREGLSLVREAAGPDVFLLGCCVAQNMRSFGGSFGLVDAMRVGADNGAGWPGLLEGPWCATNRYFLHGRVWYNDPDPLYVRPSLSLEESRLICSWVAVTGFLNTFSEWLPGLPEERVEILRRTMPNHGLRARPVDLLELPIARLWTLADDASGPRRTVLGAFNWDNANPVEIDTSLERLGLEAGETYVGFDYWADRFVPPFGDRLRLTLAPGSCRVLSLRPAADCPQLVSTSRHVTQGIVEVLAEQWDGRRLTLRGRSRVVAGDPYELRVAVPLGEESFRLAEARGSGVTLAGEADCGQQGPLVRVGFRPTESGELAWELRFTRGAVETPEAGRAG